MNALSLTLLLVLSSSFSVFAADSSAATTANEIHPLLVGAQAPSVTVKDASGKAINLAEYVKQEPTIVVFYRGSWCPFCMKQLTQLETYAGELKNLGYRMVAISQDSPETNGKAQKKHNLSFPIFSDGNMDAAKSFGLAFQVDSETTTRYKGYGIDLVGLYGRKAPLMAVPGVFVFGKKGNISFQYVNPDYRMRLAPEVLIAAAKLH